MNLAEISLPSLHYGSMGLLLLGMQYSAGPANILVASTIAKNGFKSGIPLIAGLYVPAVVYLAIVGFGLQSIQGAYQFVFDALTLLGTLYLFYLGYRFFTAPANIDEKTVEKIAGFKEGFILACLNGKLIAAILTVFAVSLTEESTHYSVLTVMVLFVVSGVTANFLWGAAGKVFSKLMGPETIKLQNYIYGALIIGVAVWMLWLLIDKMM